MDFLNWERVIKGFKESLNICNGQNCVVSQVREKGEFRDGQL